MNILKDLLKGGIKETVSSVGEVIDGIATSDDEKLAAKAKLTEIVGNQLTKVAELQASVLLAEASGNWLQRSWRPVLMLAFGFIVMYSKFIAPAFNLPNTELEAAFWDLLSIGMGGYVIGRSVEKVADTVTKNVDLTFLKKKNREV